jgi:sterol desaturase/sphingolipid hydroxylase (fatty acid hydroxylase superfamily)
MNNNNLSMTLEFSRLCLWLILLTIVFVPLERLFAHQSQKVFRKGIFLDLCYYFLSSIVPAVLLSVPISLVAFSVHMLLPVGFIETMSALPPWGRIMIGFVAGEIGYYWGHRWSHESAFLWDFHAVHHSSEELDFLSNSRAHPFDMVFSRFTSFVPIYLLGLGGPSQESGNVVPVTVTLLATTWGYFIHSNLRWRFGPLEWLLSSPAFHHWHHTANGPINKNYSSTLPLLDYLFGTFHLPKNQWPAQYGIIQKMPETLIGQILFPFDSADSVPPRTETELIQSNTPNPNQSN